MWQVSLPANVKLLAVTFRKGSASIIDN